MLAARGLAREGLFPAGLLGPEVTLVLCCRPASASEEDSAFLAGGEEGGCS